MGHCFFVDVALTTFGVFFSWINNTVALESHGEAALPWWSWLSTQGNQSPKTQVMLLHLQLL